MQPEANSERSYPFLLLAVPLFCLQNGFIEGSIPCCLSMLLPLQSEVACSALTSWVPSVWFVGNHLWASQSAGGGEKSDCMRGQRSRGRGWVLPGSGFDDPSVWIGFSHLIAMPACRLLSRLCPETSVEPLDPLLKRLCLVPEGVRIGQHILLTILPSFCGKDKNMPFFIVHPAYTDVSARDELSKSLLFSSKSVPEEVRSDSWQLLPCHKFC